MTSWMDLLEIPIKPSSPDNGKFQEQNIERICDLIDAKRKEMGDLDSSKVVLAGFSQGAALALACSVRYKEALGGCVILSGWALPHQDIASKLRKRGDVVKNTTYCVAHGESDNVVLTTCGKNVNEILSASGCSVTFQTYPHMAHSSSKEEMSDVLEFLQGVFDSDDEASP